MSSSPVQILMATKDHGKTHPGMTTVDLVREDGALIDARCSECPWTYSGDPDQPV